MMRTPPFLGAGTLTTLETALAALLDGVSPVAPYFVPLEQAMGRIAAAMPPIARTLPSRDIAALDGWACRALDLVGASAYSPLALPAAPVWVEAGDAMPSGTDCLLHADLIDCSMPIAMAVGEAVPGQGMRRRGEDMAEGRPPVLEGETIRAADLLVARRAGLQQLAVREPRVRVIDIEAANHETVTTHLIRESVTASNAAIAQTETTLRDAASIAAALDGEACDLLLLVGGTGEGRADATAEALARRNALIAHRLALKPGTTTAIGRFGSMPVIALPGAPEHAFAGFLALIRPILDRLAGRSARSTASLPLSRKISSTVGLCEIVLLGREHDMWTPLAMGDFSLEAMRLADAWLVVPGDCEGYAAGTPVAASTLRNSD